jgi:hypothetical protein
MYANGGIIQNTGDGIFARIGTDDFMTTEQFEKMKQFVSKSHTTVISVHIEKPKDDTNKGEE